MGSLTFRFSGVCTHFCDGIVPGVPHRVVLCDLTKVGFGGLQITGDPPREPVLYYTTPHFAQLDLKAAGASACPQALPDIDDAPDLSYLLNIPNVLHYGDIYSGVRLQVINATDAGRIEDLKGIESLRSYFPNYAPSSEVVLNGRARLYLDLFGGCSWVTEQVPQPPSELPLPKVVWIRVATDGPPKLLFTPLISSASWAPQVIKLPTDPPGGDFTMFVKNLEAQDHVGLDSDFKKGAYDYLLHYTTAQGGIPQVLLNRPPGLTSDFHEELPDATLPDIGISLRIMGDALLDTDPTARRTLVTPDSVTPACADSQYP